MVSSKTYSKAHFSKLIALISPDRPPIFYRVIAATCLFPILLNLPLYILFNVRCPQTDLVNLSTRWFSVERGVDIISIFV